MQHINLAYMYVYCAYTDYRNKKRVYVNKYVKYALPQTIKVRYE